MKFFLVGRHSSGKVEILNILKNKGIKCGKNFSNAENMSNKIYNYNEYEFYNNKDINEIFENNAYIFIKEHQDTNLKNSYKYYEGLSKYNFDKNEIFVLSPDQFLALNINNIKDRICIIWLDNTKINRYSRFQSEKQIYDFDGRENIESSNLSEFVENLYNFPNSDIIYFSNEEPNRIAVIIYSIIKYPELYDLYIENFK